MSDGIVATILKQARGALQGPLVVVLCLGPAACQQRTQPEDTAEAADLANSGDAPAARPDTVQPEASEPDQPKGAADRTGLAADTSAATRGTAPAAASGGDPSWMRVDQAAKTVRFDVVAGLDATNSSWNFNGYANGDLTITVPQGWTVTLTFTNHDGDVPHSIYFLEQGPPFPTLMPDRPGIPRAYSINLKNGIGAGKEDQFRFPVDEPGRYTMPCGVAGHATAGMWDWFVVSAEAQRPSVETAS